MCANDCKKTRTRSCNNPVPVNGGSDCDGKYKDVTECFVDYCKIDGNWGKWNSWSKCKSNCKKRRSRSCNNPAPVNRGRDCVGEDKDVKNCSGDNCKIDGNWGDWSPWSACGNNCKKTRSRSCDNPVPVNKGRDCDGDEEESITCLPMVITSSRMVDVSGCQTNVIKVLAIGGGGGGAPIDVSRKW